MFKMTTEAICASDLLKRFQRKDIGAVVSFEGRVRDHNLGRKVRSLDYEAFEELADSEGNLIVQEAKQRFNLLEVVAVHRHGSLQLEDIAVAVVVCSSHRDDAFLACRFIIDEIKTRVPIWKKEHYLAGDAEWVGCPTCAKHQHPSHSAHEHHAHAHQ